MLLATLTSIDYGVIALYMLAMVGLGFYFSGEQRTTQDFFLGGRSFSWFPLGMSLMATLISAVLRICSGYWICVLRMMARGRCGFNLAPHFQSSIMVPCTTLFRAR